MRWAAITWIGTSLMAPGALAQAQPAQDAAIRDDLRCLAVLAVLAQSPEQTLPGMLGGAYYLGRLESRMTEEELAKRVVAEARTMTQADAQTTMNRCAADLQASGQRLQDLGDKVQEPPAATTP